jgi:ankyrin repeat protein
MPATVLHSSDSYLAVVRIEQYINRLDTKLFIQLGNTPLHLAVDGGHSEVVKQLLLAEASMDIKNNVSSVSTITLYVLVIMLESSLMGHLIGQPVRPIGTVWEACVRTVH